MFVRMFAYCICVCKPKFLAYAILMVLHILHWLAHFTLAGYSDPALFSYFV